MSLYVTPGVNISVNGSLSAMNLKWMSEWIVCEEYKHVRQSKIAWSLLIAGPTWQHCSTGKVVTLFKLNLQSIVVREFRGGQMKDGVQRSNRTEEWNPNRLMQSHKSPDLWIQGSEWDKAVCGLDAHVYCIVHCNYYFRPTLRQNWSKDQREKMKILLEKPVDEVGKRNLTYG